MAEEQEASPISYEDLAQIEHEFDDIDTEILRKQYTLSAPVYAKRHAAIAKIPNFWPLVFEQAPPDIDQFIQPTDSEIFSECLTGLDVTRFELSLGPEKIVDGSLGGSPRSLCIRFEFAQNDWFTDEALEKRFWYRRANDGWVGLVSEPVKVHWKKGKDMTQGLMDGVIKLWEARKKAGDMKKKDLSEYTALAKIVDNWNGSNTTFFTWFAFISGRRWVSAEESAQATKEEAERRRKVNSGEKVESPGMSEDDGLEQEVEVHEAGDDLATMIAEDLWPSAIKYFTQAQEVGDLSDMDFEDSEDDADMDDEDDGDEIVDIRSLVKGRGVEQSDTAPPKKKQRK